MKRVLLRLLGPVLLLFVIYFCVDLSVLRNVLLRARLSMFVPAFLLMTVLVLVRSLRWKNVLAKNGIPYSLWKAFRIYFVEMIAVNVVSTIGTFVKAAYPKRDGYGSLPSFLSVIEDKYFDYILPLVIGLTSILLILLKFTSSPSLIVLLVAAGIAFVPARRFITVFYDRLVPTRLRKYFTGKGWRFEEHFTEIERVLDVSTYLLSTAGFVLYYFIVYILCKSLSIDLTFTEVILIQSVTSIVVLIPISFFGIGTRDVGLVAIFAWFGYSSEEAVALSAALLLFRVLIVLVAAVFWCIDPPPLSELKWAGRPGSGKQDTERIREDDDSRNVHTVYRDKVLSERL